MSRKAKPELVNTALHETSADIQTIFIVANRLPVEYHAVAGWRPSPGGLVSALEAAFRNRNIVWVGWRGSPVPEDGSGPRSTSPPRTSNIKVIEVPINQSEAKSFYNGVCNSAIWPLYHQSAVAPIFNSGEFKVYKNINQRFAEYITKSAPVGAQIWIHDYQLQLVPAFLRLLRPDLRIGFFLHIPFPTQDALEKLPWKADIINGLLGADLIGFQTDVSAQNFINLACSEREVTRDGQLLLITNDLSKRCIKVGTFPVGTDAEQFSNLAAKASSREAAARIRADFGSPELMLLGIDRLDYTKGIDLRIRAVAQLLNSAEFQMRNIQFIQVAMPSRIQLPAYKRARLEVEIALHQANKELKAKGLRPIHYIHEPLPTDQVAALYVASDVMLVTSHADGMNLVSKEYIACQNADTGRLVLTKTTGAAAQLLDAWLVEPNDINDLKHGIAEAIRANPTDAQRRMKKMRKIIFEADAKYWARSFLVNL